MNTSANTLIQWSFQNVMTVNRRKFIKMASAAAVASQTAPTYAQGDALEPLRIAVVGFGGRGKQHIQAIKKSEHAKLVALADVDQKILHNAEKDNRELFRTDDFRRLLDRNDIDAIATATPNHWHTLVTMMACQAGKHVYVEKPISHNMTESAIVAGASDRFEKIIQCGFQNRSDVGLIEFFEKLHRGDFGKVLAVHGTCHRPRASIGKLSKPLEVAKHINYDVWLGPAADQPILRPRLHYDWHWDFNTGNGDVGNQGPHEWDLINWALGDPEALPTKMTAAGNRFAWQDGGNTPNVMACVGTFAGTPIRFEVMDLVPGRSAPDNQGVGVIIHTESGRFVGGRGGGRFVANDGTTERFNGTQSENLKRTQFHMDNFVDAVMSNDRDRLRSDCKVAARSSALAHMANISFQLAEEAPAEALESALSGTVGDRDMLARMRESTMLYASKNEVGHLEPWLLGPSLNFDNESDSFVGTMAEAANAKRSREYREGFEIPRIA